MQRINWFPDPNITQTFAHYASSTMKVDFPVVNGRNWLRAISTATGNNYAQYILAGSQLPPAGSYHVHTVAYAQVTGAAFVVFVHVGDTYSAVCRVPVGDGQTVTVDRTITIPSNTDQLLVRIELDPNTVGAKGMMSDILIERADTYDTAVGGGFRASSQGIRCRSHRSVRRAGDAR